jgi:hypothetical protein
VLAGAGLKEMQDDLAQLFWSNVYNRLERHTGWILTVVGLVVALGYGLYELMTQPGVAPSIKFGVGATLMGLALIFGGVLRMSLKIRRKERYSEIIR